MGQDRIVISGAREHNLKISLEIPRGALTVFTGASGGGAAVKETEESIEEAAVSEFRMLFINRRDYLPASSNRTDSPNPRVSVFA
jgi:hypothetical protein